MHVVVVEFRLHPGRMPDFLPLMREQARASLANERDCHVFDVCVDPADSDRVFLYEVYTSREAFDHHLRTPHFLGFDVAVKDLVAGKSVSQLTRLEG